MSDGTRSEDHRGGENNGTGSDASPPPPICCCESGAGWEPTGTSSHRTRPPPGTPVSGFLAPVPTMRRRVILTSRLLDKYNPLYYQKSNLSPWGVVDGSGGGVWTKNHATATHSVRSFRSTSDAEEVEELLSQQLSTDRNAPRPNIGTIQLVRLHRLIRFKIQMVL